MRAIKDPSVIDALLAKWNGVEAALPGSNGNPDRFDSVLAVTASSSIVASVRSPNASSDVARKSVGFGAAYVVLLNFTPSTNISPDSSTCTRLKLTEPNV